MGAWLAVPELAMIDELTDAVARAGSLTHEQAALAVAAMLRFMAARLPSPLFGELQSRLQSGAAPGPGPASGRGPASP